MLENLSYRLFAFTKSKINVCKSTEFEMKVIVLDAHLPDGLAETTTNFKKREKNSSCCETIFLGINIQLEDAAKVHAFPWTEEIPVEKPVATQTADTKANAGPETVKLDCIID